MEDLTLALLGTFALICSIWTMYTAFERFNTASTLVKKSAYAALGLIGLLTLTLPFIIG